MSVPVMRQLCFLCISQSQVFLSIPLLSSSCFLAVPFQASLLPWSLTPLWGHPAGGAWSPSLGDPSAPWGKVFLPLSWHIDMSLERQGEKAQKSKRGKNNHCKCRASSMQRYAHSSAGASSYTTLVQHELECGESWTPLLFLLAPAPHTRGGNEMATISLAPPSNLGNLSEPSTVVSHGGRGHLSKKSK